MNNKLEELLKINAIEIDKQIEKLIPKNIDDTWLEKYIGIPSFEYDEKACTEAISKPIWDLLERGGKRWRPLLMKLAYTIIREKENDIINKFFIIPELIHNGTLIVDDIEDDSRTRRGRPCIHKLFGKDIAINAGNALYYLPLILIKNSSLDFETKTKF